MGKLAIGVHLSLDIDMTESTISQLFALNSTSKVCVLSYSNYRCIYPVERGLFDSVNPCGSEQLPQFFLSYVYGISKKLEKILVEIMDRI